MMTAEGTNPGKSPIKPEVMLGIPSYIHPGIYTPGYTPPSLYHPGYTATLPRPATRLYHGSTGYSVGRRGGPGLKEGELPG